MHYNHNSSYLGLLAKRKKNKVDVGFENFQATNSKL